MKKIILLAGLLATGMYYAQIKFQKGYFIDNSGEKKIVLIKDMGWKNNPVDFEYKSENSTGIQKANINDVKEFGIDEGAKYVRAKVMLDVSSKDLASMSDNRAPELKENTLFLKYIIEGKADLLFYEDGNGQKFFYSSENSDPQPLIYKPYYVADSSIGYNEDYKKQILENLKCGIDSKQLNHTTYSKKDLAKVFTQYNNCSGTEVINYGKSDTKKALFHISIRPGINSSSLTSGDPSQYFETKFGNSTTFRIGVEFEYVLPFNKNKWALFIEPTYQYYKKEAKSVAAEGWNFNYNYDANVDYKSIELPIGLRHYFFLSEKSKLFLNAAYVMDFNMNSSMKVQFNDIEIASGNNFVFGAGYKYNDRFSAEVRISTTRTLLRGSNNPTSDYKTVSFILGYTLF